MIKNRDLSLIEWIIVVYIAFTAGFPIILCLMGAFAIAYISNIFNKKEKAK